MIYEYVVTDWIENEDDGDAEMERVILAEGKLLARDRNAALLKIGAVLGSQVTDSTTVTLREFVENVNTSSWKLTGTSSTLNVGTGTYPYGLSNTISYTG